jgi:heptosyltransferase-2
MAKALGVPTYSIYSPWIRKEAWDTHKDDARHKAVHLRDFEPALFENKDKKEFREASLEYYTYFRPDLFAQDMLSFLRNYLS